jgi:hypothetical protein
MGSYYGQILTRLENEGGCVRSPTNRRFQFSRSGIWEWLSYGGLVCAGFRREVRVIDYLENSGEGLPWYIKEVRNKPYVYSTHWAPHDIEVRELGSGSVGRTAFNPGLYFRVVPNLPVQDGLMRCGRSSALLFRPAAV